MTEPTTDIEVKEKYFDTEKVIASKNAKLARWLPGFVMSWFKRLVHEDDLNGMMDRYGHYMGVDFLEAVLVKQLELKIVIKGLENIPKTGGVIITSNHPLGGVDGVAFMYAVGQVRTDIQFLVNDILLRVKNLEMFFVPVNKLGNNPREASIMIQETYKKDVAVLVFPSGLVSRKLPTGIQDLKWQKSFIVRAKKYHKDIVPVHIDGQNSRRFYNFSVLRHKLGIKANLEMALLASELFRQKGNTITIRIGKPVSYESFDKSKTPEQWAAKMREITYDLPNKM